MADSIGAHIGSASAGRDFFVNVISPQVEGDAQQRAISKLYLRAEDGDIAAQIELAAMLQYGKNIDKDLGEAIRLLHLAIEKGSEHAKMQLLMLYNLNGMLFLNEACKLAKDLAQSADSNLRTIGAGTLCLIYLDGLGVKKDRVKGVYWRWCMRNNRRGSEAESETIAIKLMAYSGII